MLRRVPAPVPSTVAALSWGTMFPIAAAALPRVDAFNLTAIRYAGASVIFVMLLLVREGRAAVGFDGRFARLFVLGTLGFAGFNLLTYVGLKSVQPQDAALIVATMPLMTLLVRWVLDGERPSRLELTGVAVALLGVALVISRGHPEDLVSDLHLGELLVLGGVFGFILYTRGAREFPGFSTLRYTTLSAVGGTITIVVATAAADVLGWQTLPDGADLVATAPAIAYVIIFGAVIGVLFWNTGVRRLGLANAALFMNLVPITAFAIQIARGYVPSPGELAGAVLTVAALVTVNLVGRRQPAPGGFEARSGALGTV